MSKLAGKLVREIIRVQTLIAASLVGLRDVSPTPDWVIEGEKIAREVIGIAIEAIESDEPESMSRAINLLRRFDVYRSEVHIVNMPKIVTTHVYPPIPDRSCDWQAYYDGDEPNDDGQMPHGSGSTEQEAIEELIANHPRVFAK